MQRADVGGGVGASMAGGGGRLGRRDGEGAVSRVQRPTKVRPSQAFTLLNNFKSSLIIGAVEAPQANACLHY